MKTAHNTTGKHKCLICDDISPSLTVLAEHKLTHCKIGVSDKCSYCQGTIRDATCFRSHLQEHNNSGATVADFPIQCVCCRQTLTCPFEVGLHAK